MANSLETRAPLLDYRVVEFASRIPSTLKLFGKEKKYILKKLFSDLLSDEIIYRKKMGFSVPLADWLRQELFESMNNMMTSGSSGVWHFFDQPAVAKIWQKHLAGSNQSTQELWSMLVFNMWWQKYID
jgi:asparagine synthase (glutamine-hydrolysing)